MKNIALLFFMLLLGSMVSAQDTLYYRHFGVDNRSRLAEDCYWLTQRTNLDMMLTLHAVAQYNDIAAKLPNPSLLTVNCLLADDKISEIMYSYRGSPVLVNHFGQYRPEKMIVIVTSAEGEAPYLDLTFFDDGSKIDLFKADLDSNQVRIYAQVHGHRSGDYRVYTLAGEPVIEGCYAVVDALTKSTFVTFAPDDTQGVQVAPNQATAVPCGTWRYFELGKFVKEETFRSCK